MFNIKKIRKDIALIKERKKMYQYNAIDKDGIPRVWGRAPTKKEAKDQCKKALIEYCNAKRKNGLFYWSQPINYKLKLA